MIELYDRLWEVGADRGDEYISVACFCQIKTRSPYWMDVFPQDGVFWFQLAQEWHIVVEINDLGYPISVLGYCGGGRQTVNRFPEWRKAIGASVVSIRVRHFPEGDRVWTE